MKRVELETVPLDAIKRSDFYFEIEFNTAELRSKPKSEHTVIIISGPPGGGKDTLVDELIYNLADETGQPFVRFRTATTRAPRRSELEQEVDPYIRYDEATFQKAAQHGEFLETNHHMSDKGVHYYGTPISEFDRIWEIGGVPILRVDPNGALSLRNLWKEGRTPLDKANLVYFYITPPSREILKERLISREITDGNSVEKAVRAVDARWNQVIKDLQGHMHAHYILINYDNQLHECAITVCNVLHELHTK